MMHRKRLLPLALAALLLAAAAAPALAKKSKGDDDSSADDDGNSKGSKDRTAYSKGFLRKGADIVGCKTAENADDDNASPTCTECKGPNFVYNAETDACDCAAGYGTYATQHGTGKLCQRCPKGWYGEGGAAGDAECQKCPDCTSTAGASKKGGGAKSVDACNVYEPGYGWSGVGDDDDGAGSCAICEVGSWSDGGLRLGNGCYDCPRSHSGLRTTTADEGAVTPSACKIEVCKPGYAVNKLGSCKKCPEGYTSDGGSVEDGADQPLCREADDDDDDAPADDDGGDDGKKGGKGDKKLPAGVADKGPKDGGKGKKYAPEGDDEQAGDDGAAAKKAAAAAAVGSRKLDAGAAAPKP